MKNKRIDTKITEGQLASEKREIALAIFFFAMALLLLAILSALAQTSDGVSSGKAAVVVSTTRQPYLQLFRDPFYRHFFDLK